MFSKFLLEEALKSSDILIGMLKFIVSAKLSFLLLIVTDGLDISVVAKRRAPWISGQAWEPIYIGTNQDPLYDERLHWEGKADKMSQVYFVLFFWA